MWNSDIAREQELEQEISVQAGWIYKTVYEISGFFFVAGPRKLLSFGMWRRVVWYIIVLKCQRNLLPPLSRLGADGTRPLLWYTSTGLERVTLQKALELEPTIFIVFGAWMPGALYGNWISVYFILELRFHCSVLCLCCRKFWCILQFQSNWKIIGPPEYFCVSDYTNWISCYYYDNS